MNLRLGFAIDGFDIKMGFLKKPGIIFSAEPTQTDFGYMAIVRDPDGRKLELYRK